MDPLDKKVTSLSLKVIDLELKVISSQCDVQSAIATIIKKIQKIEDILKKENVYVDIDHHNVDDTLIDSEASTVLPTSVTSKKDHYVTEGHSDNESQLEATENEVLLEDKEMVENKILLSSQISTDNEDPEQKLLYCQICHRTGFKSVNKLEIHVKEEHKIPLQALPPEGEELPKRKPRFRKKKQEIPSSCKTCSKVFPTRRRLLKHTTRVHGQKVICDLCSLEVSNLDSLRRHKSFQHGILRPNSIIDLKPLSCFLCQKRFIDRKSLESHVDRLVCVNRQKRQELMNEKITKGLMREQIKILCGYEGCAKKFNNQSSAWRHKSKAHGIHRTFKCKKCDKEFSNKRFQVKHVKSVHPAPGVNGRPLKSYHELSDRSKRRRIKMVEAQKKMIFGCNPNSLSPIIDPLKTTLNECVDIKVEQ